jgi:hypothetical protein
MIVLKLMTMIVIAGLLGLAVMMLLRPLIGDESVFFSFLVGGIIGWNWDAIWDGIIYNK